jgi:HEAT repeat protein
MANKRIFATVGWAIGYVLVLATIGWLAVVSYNYYENSVKSSGKTKKDSIKASIKIFKFDPINLLDSEDQHAFEKSIFHIENMGEAGVDRLISVMSEPKMTDFKRKNTIYVLGRLGKNAIKSAAKIRPYLKHTNKEVRGVSARALAKMDDLQSAKNIAFLLYDDDKWVRESAVTALKMINTAEAQQSLKEYNKSNR